MPTASSWVREKTSGPGSWPTCAPDSRGPSTDRRSGRSRPCPPSGATSSSVTSTSCPTRSWSPAVVPTPATSATRRPSSREGRASTRRGWTRPSRRSRAFPAAGTVTSVLKPALLEKAVAAGLRSLFVGFETLNPAALRAQGKVQNLRRDYGEAVRRLHGLGVMVNGSFVFGMDEDDASVFDRTVGWAIDQGIETATFHILTPYPGTALFGRMEAEGRLLHRDWDLYDTRHVVFATRGMTAEELEAGYWRAYRDFYRWRSIFRGAATKPTWPGRLRHFAYAGGWKKFEPLWDWVIRARKVSRALPLLEAVLG